MSPFEFAVTYAVCWWLVLFMVLPHQAQAAAKPETGHAPSAPANPQLRRKCGWATLLAFIPAIALFLIVHEAKAEEVIYHAGSKCKALATHTPSTDVETRDGYSTGGKKVAPATLDNTTNYMPEKFDIPIIPSTGDYVKTNPGQQKILRDSFIDAGTVSVSKDGGVSMNGAAIVPQETYPEDCQE